MPTMKCPTSLLNSPDWWTPEQILEFQQCYDWVLAGNSVKHSICCDQVRAKASENS